MWAQGSADISFNRCSFLENDSDDRNITCKASGGNSPTIDFINCTISSERIELNGDTFASFTHCTFAGTGYEIAASDSSISSYRACLFESAPARGIGAGFTITSLGYNAASSDVFGVLDSSTDLISSFLYLGPLTERDGKYYYHPAPASPAGDAIPTTETGLLTKLFPRLVRGGDPVTCFSIPSLRLANLRSWGKVGAWDW